MDTTRRNLLSLVCWHDSESRVFLPWKSPAQGWTLEAAVAGICKPSDKDTTPIDTYKQRIAADIIGPLRTQVSGTNWDGLAINTEFGEVGDYTGNDGSVAGRCRPAFDPFRTDENDLYTVRA